MLDLVSKRFVTLDIECKENIDGKRFTFSESHFAGIAVACTVDQDGRYKDWIHDESAHLLVEYLLSHDYVVGYNTLGFDYPLLGGSWRGKYDLKSPSIIKTILTGKTIDICADFKETLGTRVSLKHVAVPTLGEDKLMEGSLAPERWRKREALEVITYCRDDVKKTDALFKMACRGEKLKVLTKEGQVREFTCTPKLR